MLLFVSLPCADLSLRMDDGEEGGEVDSIVLLDVGRSFVVSDLFCFR